MHLLTIFLIGLLAAAVYDALRHVLLRWLERSYFKSANYKPGVTGWAMRGDGRAEFNNVDFAADFVAGVPSPPVGAGQPETLR